MATYSDAFIQSIIKKFIESGLSIRKFAKQEGLNTSTLYNWQKKYVMSGNVVSKVNKSNNRSPDEKFSIVLETATMSEIELSEFCRSKGLYPQDIKGWKQDFIRSNMSNTERKREEAKERKADKKRIKELEKELKRKDAALAETAALLVLRKKLNAYWGENEES